MAQSYLRTIEFKVKDAALKDAVGKLGKSLGSIDKNVAQINKSFAGLSKSLKGVAAEFRQIAKSSEKLAKSSGKQKSPLDPKQLTKSAIGIKKIKGLLADLNQKGGLTVGSGKTAGFNQALDKLRVILEDLSGPGGKLAQTEAGLRKQATAFNTIAANSKVSTNATKIYAQAITGLTKAEQALGLAQLKRVQVQKTAYATGSGGGFKNTQDLLKMEGSDEVGKTIAGLAIYRGELEKALSVTDMTSKEFEDIKKTIERINTQLAEGTKIKTKEQDLNAQAKKDAKEKLALAIKEQRARQQAMKDLIKQINIGGKFAGKGLGAFFGLLQGKKGTLPQVAAGGTLLETIKGLVKFLPFVDKRIKDNIRSYADLGEKALIVIGGIRLASIGLSGVLGATKWVTEAVKGFIQFEDAASKVIWSIEGNMGRAFSLFGRLARELPQLASAVAMTMPKVLGGMGVSGSPLDYMADKSASNTIAEAVMGRRFEGRRYGRQGPTGLQKDERRLEWYNKLLTQRNRTADDYVKILNKAVQVEQQISRETKMQTIMREHANGTIARQIRQQDLALRKQRRDKRRDRRQAFQDRREAFEFQQAEFNAQTYMQPGTQAAMVSGRDPNRRVRKDVWARHQRMQQSRQQRRARLNEGLMLGAGFPMLFGGGVGSVGGGVAGAVLQSKMGPGAGFGAQILLSALGQQIDAFVGKTKELADAIRKPTKNLGALVQAAGLTDTPLGNQIKQLEALGLKASAAALATNALTAKIGKKGMDDLKKFSDEWLKFSSEMEVARLKLMAFISGPLSLLAKTLNFLNEKDMKAEAQKLANKDTIAKFGARPSMKHPLDIPGLWNVLTETNPGTSREDYRDKRQDLHFKNLVNQSNAPITDVQDRIKTIQGQDTKDLQSKVELEKKRLSMSSSSFEIKTKEIELNRQQLEINWQLAEWKKMEDGVEKDILQTKIEKLVATRDLSAAELENFKTLNKLDGKWQEIAGTIENGVVNAIEGAIKGTQTLGDVASSVFNQIASQLLKMGVNSLLGGIFPDLFPKRAAGGPVTGGSPYIVGEEGPELFVPGASGNIVPNHDLGKGSNVVVNVDASGSSVQGDTGQAEELGSMLAAAIQSELVNQQRPGGLLY